MIDTHTHLDFKEFDCDREDAIRRFFDAGGEKLINVGCELASSTRSVELAEKYENIFASVGVHPHDAESFDGEALKRLEELVVKEKVVAVGEIGLDFFRDLSPREIQIEAFKTQLELAAKHKKPVIIHCRDAYVDLVDILKSYKTANWVGVTHCFLGSWPIAEELLKMGFYLGFTGAITYPKKRLLTDPLGLNFNTEPEIFTVVKNTPLDRILIETDCPYLAPVPCRGKRNEPSFVKYVAEKIAELKGISAEEVEKAASKNAGKLFGI
jgi:TatD DNase family protein